MKNQKIIQKIINYIDSILKYTSNWPGQDLKKLIVYIVTTINNQEKSINANLFNGLFIGYGIPYIGKVFDQLRFGNAALY